MPGVCTVSRKVVPAKFMVKVLDLDPVQKSVIWAPGLLAALIT